MLIRLENIVSIRFIGKTGWWKVDVYKHFIVNWHCYIEYPSNLFQIEFNWNKMAELLLDSAIRFWVFMPIVVITFFVGMLRHYISIITTGEKPVDKQQLADR